MGVHLDSAKVGAGLHRRISLFSTAKLADLTVTLGVDTSDMPDTDLYDWIRQRIYDELTEEADRRA